MLAECPGNCSPACGLLNECRGQPTTSCCFPVLCMCSHGVSLLYCYFSGWFLCSCSGMSSCWACWMRRTAIPSTAKQVSQADRNVVQDSITFSAASRLQLVWMTRTCMANKHFGTKALFFVPEQTVTTLLFLCQRLQNLLVLGYLLTLHLLLQAFMH